jgi:hypothetical protein
MLVIAHGQVQSKMAQEIHCVQEEPISPEHARTSTYTVQKGTAEKSLKNARF